jgi:hypothetical protein
MIIMNKKYVRAFVTREREIGFDVDFKFFFLVSSAELFLRSRFLLLLPNIKQRNETTTTTTKHTNKKN